MQTRLSHVDGRNGVLVIGGYGLEELAGRVTFEEAAHLLWTGHLPTPGEAEGLSREMAALRPIPARTMAVVCEAAKRRALPIDALRMACSTLSLDLRSATGISPDADLANAKMLVARLPTVVAAWIRLRAGASATEQEIRDYCAGRVAHFKVPQYIRFVDAFPMTVTGKLQKFRMREQEIRERSLEAAAKVETA